ncbi:MAG: hypothetical protein QXK06_01620 [Candidatus Diapherotrites archaeon]
MKILIPLISKKENSQDFLEQALEKAREVILLLPVDTPANATSGFTMAEVGQGENLMSEIQAFVGKKKKKCETVVQWGDTAKNIDHVARLKGVETIVLLKQDNEFFKRLAGNLRKSKEYSLKIIEIAQEKANQK